MRQDDSDDSSPSRADLEARLQALEAKRDQLLKEIAAQRLDVGDRPAHGGQTASPVSVLQVLDGTLKAVQPVMGMMTSAHEMLLVERADAERRNDSAGAGEATRLLDELSMRFDELRASIAQLNVAAATVRESLSTDGSNDAKSKDAG